MGTMYSFIIPLRNRRESPCHGAGGVGDALQFGALALDVQFLKHLHHVAEVLVSGVEGDVIVVDFHLFQTTVNEGHFQLVDVHVGLAGDDENALTGKQEAQAAIGLHGAAILVHNAADVGNGTHVVVRQAFDEEGDAVIGVALEGDFLQDGGILVAGLVDGTHQGVLRHVAATGILHQQTEAGVAVGIRTALADGYGYLFQNFGILFRALGIGCTFGSLNF